MKNLIWAITVLILLINCKEKKPLNLEHKQELTENEIPTTTLNQLSIDSLLVNNMTSKLENQEYPNIHSVLIAKNGKVFYEKYFKGQDYLFGKDIGIVQFSDSTLHDIRSLTKSIVSACVGIAIHKGYLKNVDQKIASFFPELDTLFVEEKSNWTIQHFLTMTTGLDWNENVPYDNPENDEIQMTSSQDPIKYVLSQPMINEPDEKFNYSGGATQVLAEIIIRTSKIPLDQFVKEHLFDPLEIENFEWTKYSMWEGADKFAAPSGLRLTSRDLMKIGLLYRDKGNWKGSQIIPATWIQESFVSRVEFPSTVGDGNDAYGYQFWMWPDLILNKEFKMVAAIGNGGQNIFWDLKNDIIVVTTAGNYNKWDIKNDPYALLRNEIYPLIFKEE